jgi:hypothetical protein
MQGTAHAQPMKTASTAILATLKPAHPRLMVSSTTWDEIKMRRREDATLDAILKRNELEARALLDVPPVTRIVKGRRLLEVSRTVLRRMLLLGMHARLTGDKALVQRAKEEMLAVAAFEDWHPTHFLDVGEITLGLAIGYDWLYDDLDADTRQIIRIAIVEKGLKPGLDSKYNWWKTAEHNWNTVCLSGMTLGALAIAEDEPALAAQTLQFTKEFNPYGLKAYAPAGVYPEGPSYWAYSASWEAILIDALQSALGTDWGLSQSPGFMQAADAVLQTRGPSNAFFNYSDGTEQRSLEGGNFWFAHELKRPELMGAELDRVKKYANSKKPPEPLTDSDRLMPLLALWWPGTGPAKSSAPTQWYGRGSVPLATFRTAWNDPSAMFLALKGGKAAAPHGHMDAGSFVFEADGVRWGRDLGLQPYGSLESKGVKLFDSKQEGDRWKVFRLNNFSHSTLTINGQLHVADGQAEITHFSVGKDAGAIVDLSPVFAGQAGRVMRGFAFRDDHVLIRDELEGLKAGDKVRWAMLTSAQVAISDDGTEATLTQSDKQLRIRLNSSAKAKLEVISVETPQNDYDAPNPNYRMLIANFVAPATGQLAWSVALEPQSRAPKPVSDPLAQTKLTNWPQTPTQMP